MAEPVALDQLKEWVRVRRMRPAPRVLPELEADAGPRPPWSRAAEAGRGAEGPDSQARSFPPAWNPSGS